MVIFTCSIFPHLTRIWSDYTLKILGDNVDIFIYDCSGMLKKKHFPGVNIKRHPNHEHGRKIDHFLESSKDELVFIIDDDAFIHEADILEEIQSAFLEDERLAIYSMHERHHWQYELNNQIVRPIGTYAFAVNARIIKREKLSLKSFKTNQSWVNNGKGYWDTANYAQFELMKRSYQVKTRKGVGNQPFPALFGTSSGFVSLFQKDLLRRNFRFKVNKKKFNNLLQSDEYFLLRTMGVATILEIYKSIYGSVNIRLPLSLEELMHLAENNFPDSYYLIENPKKIRQLIAGRLETT